MDFLYGHLDLPGRDALVFDEAMRELPVLLARPSAELEVAAEPLPVSVDLTRAALDALEICGSSLDGFGRRVHTQLDRDVPVVIGCMENHPLAKAVRESNSSARWGASDQDTGVALCYRMVKFLIWHEALHLLGADDCYCLPDGGPTCDQSNCIMQYEPSEQAVGEWPFLCSKNIEAIRETQADNARLMCRPCNSKKGGK